MLFVRLMLNVSPVLYYEKLQLKTNPNPIVTLIIILKVRNTFYTPTLTRDLYRILPYEYLNIYSYGTRHFLSEKHFCSVSWSEIWSAY